ncbi:MAG: MBL fold metallo-hydrolase [Deltaproteobacteria bacterium]
MRVCLLASGSKGNSIFIETGQSKILVDAGLSARETDKRLADIGVEGSDLDAIFITHEHTDHIRGAGILARKHQIPVFISYPTNSNSKDLFAKNEVVEFESGCSFTFRDMLIDPFPITHDSSDPVGFVIESRQNRVGIATDLGIVTRLVREKLKECGVLVLEFNHDEEMLLNGPYPWHLKQRIKSRHGHLSNNETAQLLSEIVHDRLEGIFLAHLSEVNNDPAIASDTINKTLGRQNRCHPELFMGCQYQVSPVFQA